MSELIPTPEKFVWYVARKYVGRCGLEPQELFNAGYYGYLRAKKNHKQPDAHEKQKLSYVYSYIKEEIVALIDWHIKGRGVPLTEAMLEELDDTAELSEIDVEDILTRAGLTEQEKIAVVSYFIRGEPTTVACKLIGLKKSRVREIRNSGIEKIRKLLRG